MTKKPTTNKHTKINDDDIELPFDGASQQRRDHDNDTEQNHHSQSGLDDDNYCVEDKYYGVVVHKECANETDDEECEEKDQGLLSSFACNSTTNKLSFLDAVCVLTTFATAGSIVAVPWAIGQLGYVLGPILLIIIALMNLYFFNFLLDVADNCKDGETCKTLGDVGYALAGNKGKILFDAFQIGNLALYMPVALETVGLSLQYLVDGSCIGWWNIASFAGLIVMIQFMKCWTNVAWIAYITVAVAAAKAFILLPYSFVLYQDDIVNSSNYLGPIQPVGNPHDPTWNSIALACSTFAFALAPVFILIEVRSDMSSPKQCKKALTVSFVVQVVMYLVPAITCVFLWGFNISSPITIEIPRGLLGILMSVVVLLAVALDFCISAKVINDWLSQFFPSSLKKWESSGSFFGKTLLYKICHSFPTSIFSLAFVLAIPNFETLIGVVTGITIIGISNWAILLAWQMGGCKYEASRILMWLGGIVGFAFTVWVVAAAVEEIVTTDYSSGSFFCSGGS